MRGGVTALGLTMIGSGFVLLFQMRNALAAANIPCAAARADAAARARVN